MRGVRLTGQVAMSRIKRRRQDVRAVAELATEVDRIAGGWPTDGGRSTWHSRRANRTDGGYEIRTRPVGGRHTENNLLISGHAREGNPSAVRRGAEACELQQSFVDTDEMPTFRRERIRTKCTNHTSVATEKDTSAATGHQVSTAISGEIVSSQCELAHLFRSAA